jgi:hypothetical protein
MQDDERRSLSVSQRILSEITVRECPRDQSIFAAGTGFFSIEVDMFSEADMLPYPYAPASTRHLAGWRTVLPMPAVP